MIEAAKVNPGWATTSMILSQAGYHHVGLIQRLIEGLNGSEGIAMSSANPGNRFASQLGNVFGSRFFQFAPKAGNHVESIDSNKLYPFAGFSEIPVSLGSRDLDILSKRRPFELSPKPALKKLRSLTTFCNHQNVDISILHIAEGLNRALEILSGGEVLVTTNQPILIFELDVNDSRKALIDYLTQIDYILLDSTFQPITDLADADQWLAAATETVFCGFARTFLESGELARMLWPTRKHLTIPIGWLDELRIRFGAEARQDGIKFSPRPSAKERILFDDNLMCEGFYSAEGQDGFFWRWLGPKPSARFYLPSLAEGHYLFEIEILQIGGNFDFEHIRLFVGGSKIGTTIEHQEGRTLLRGEFNFIRERNSDPTEFLISVPNTKRASEHDFRRLGVCLSQMDLSRTPSSR